MAIKLFTHTDLDGISCSIIAQRMLGDSVDVEYCNYNDVNQKVEEFYMGSKKYHYDRVFITDISINEEVANIINSYEGDDGAPIVQLLNHHRTALWLNEYSWAYVKTHKDEVLGDNPEELTSGTKLFYEYLLANDLIKSCRELDNLVEVVTDYDTWKWYADGNMIPKDFNDLLYILGRERFIKDYFYRHPLLMLENYELLLKLNREKIDAYIESKNKELTTAVIQNRHCGIVFAEQHISELGNKLCEMNPDVDFVAIVNPSHSVSYRTIKEDIDLGQIAKVFGGGGHPKAAGSPVGDQTRWHILQEIFGVDIFE